MSSPAATAPRARPTTEAVPWLAVAGWLLVALVLRAGLALGHRSYLLVGDSYDYDRHAEAIAETQSYPPSLDGPDGGATAFRPPLYPLFLAAVRLLSGPDHAITAARVVQALLGVAVVALIGVICWQLWGRRVALPALAIASVFPPLILVGSALLSEVPFLLFELGACAAILQARDSPHRVRWAVAAGALCGLAALTRSIGPALVIPLMLAILTNRDQGLRRALGPAAALALAAALVVAPWTVRNAIAMDAFVPVSTQGGHSLAGAYNETVGRQPASRGAWTVPWRLPDFAHLYWRRAYRQRALAAGLAPGHVPRLWRTDLSEVELERELRRAAVSYIGERPLHALEKGAFNAARLFGLGGPNRIRFSGEEVAVEPGWARKAAAYGIYPVLALALIGALTPMARQAPRWLWLVPLLFLPAALIDHLTRFRTPIDPFLIILAALALAAIAERLPARPASRRSLRCPG